MDSLEFRIEENKKLYTNFICSREMAEAINETYTQRRRRLYGKLYLKGHIRALSNLLLPDYDDERRLSIIESDVIQSKANQLFRARPYFYMTVRFEDRQKQLSKVFNHLFHGNPKCYLYIPTSYLCGLYKINIFDDFNFSFDWDAGDILSITNVSFQEKVVLDWYEENDRKLLDIVVYRNSESVDHKLLRVVREDYPFNISDFRE